MDQDKFEYFLHQTNTRLDKIDHKIDQLINFRLMLIGASMTISAIVSMGIAFLEVWAK